MVSLFPFQLAFFFFFSFLFLSMSLSEAHDDYSSSPLLPFLKGVGAHVTRKGDIEPSRPFSECLRWEEIYSCDLKAELAVKVFVEDLRRLTLKLSVILEVNPLGSGIHVSCCGNWHGGTAGGERPQFASVQDTEEVNEGNEARSLEVEICSLR